MAEQSGTGIDKLLETTVRDRVVAEFIAGFVAGVSMQPIPAADQSRQDFVEGYVKGRSTVLGLANEYLEKKKLPELDQTALLNVYVRAVRK